MCISIFIAFTQFASSQQQNEIIKIKITMQLSKLRKRSFKMQKYREKLKFLALGLPVAPTPKQTIQQIAQKMINEDACVHAQNNQQVLLSNFSDQLPIENKKLYDTGKINRLYLYFMAKVNFFDGETLDKNNKVQGDEMTQRKTNKNSKDQASSNSTRNNSEDNRAAKQFNGQTSSHQKVNFHHYNKQKNKLLYASDLMVSIYEEADKRHEIKKFKRDKIEKQIQKLYMDSHECYLLLMETKNMENQNNFCTFDEAPYNIDMTISHASKGDSTGGIRDRRNSNSDVLNKKITSLKQAIQLRQNQYKRLVEDEKVLKEEKINFLKLLLKNGQRQTDGVGWILTKLAKNNQQLYPSDLYNILDNTTRDCLLIEYQNIKPDLAKQHSSPPMKLRESGEVKEKHNRSHSNSLPAISYRLSDIPNTNDSKFIYKSTQNYIVEWVRKQRWKIRSLKHKPTLQITKPKEWRTEEIKRLKNTYSKEQYENILKYIFGSTKYFNRVNLNTVNSVKSRKQSYHRQESGNIRSSQQGAHSSRNESGTNLTRNNTNKSVVQVQMM